MDGGKLKYWRWTRGLTIRELARRSGVDPTAISLMERGKRQGRPETMAKLATVLQVEPRDLLRPEFHHAVSHTAADGNG